MSGPTKSGAEISRERARVDVAEGRKILRELLYTAPLDYTDNSGDPTARIPVGDLARIDARLERALETIDKIRAAAAGIGEPTAGPDNRFNRTRDLYTLILELL